MPAVTNLRTIKANPFVAKAYKSTAFSEGLSGLATAVGEHFDAKGQAVIDSRKSLQDLVETSTATNKGMVDTKAKEIQDAISEKVSGVATVNRRGKTKMKGKENLNSPKNRAWLAEQQLELSKIINNGRLINEDLQRGYDESENLPPEYDQVKYREGLSAMMNSDINDYDPESIKKIRIDSFSLDKAVGIKADELAVSTTTNEKSDGTFYKDYEIGYQPMLTENKDGKLTPKLADAYFADLMADEVFATAVGTASEGRLNDIKEALDNAGGQYDEESRELDEASKAALSPEDIIFWSGTDRSRNKITVEEKFAKHRAITEDLVKSTQKKKYQISVVRQKREEAKANIAKHSQWLLEKDPRAFQYVTNNELIEGMKYSPDGKSIIVSMKAGKYGYPPAYEKPIPIHGKDIDSAKSALAELKTLAQMKDQEFTKEELAQDSVITDQNNGNVTDIDAIIEGKTGN